MSVARGFECCDESVGDCVGKAFRGLPAVWYIRNFKILSGVGKWREILKAILHGPEFKEIITREGLCSWKA